MSDMIVGNMNKLDVCVPTPMALLYVGRFPGAIAIKIWVNLATIGLPTLHASDTKTPSATLPARHGGLT
jgi:hypothetical protein